MKKFLFAFLFIISSVVNAQNQELLIYGGENRKQYLGCLNCNNYDSESIWNSYGTYGSRYNTYSIWNSYGDYGSNYGTFSPFNQNAANPPIIVDASGNFYGFLTVNEYRSTRAEFDLVQIIYDNYEDIRANVSDWYDKIFD